MVKCFHWWGVPINTVSNNFVQIWHILRCVILLHEWPVPRRSLHCNVYRIYSCIPVETRLRVQPCQLDSFIVLVKGPQLGPFGTERHRLSDSCTANSYSFPVWPNNSSKESLIHSVLMVSPLMCSQSVNLYWSMNHKCNTEQWPNKI